jgi:hypothetical protein
MQRSIDGVGLDQRESAECIVVGNWQNSVDTKSNNKLCRWLSSCPNGGGWNGGIEDHEPDILPIL